MGTRLCLGCKELLPVTAEYFHAAPRGKGGFSSRCKECRATSSGERHKKLMQDPQKLDAHKARRRAYMAAYRGKHPDRVQKRNRENQLRPYGLTVEAFEALLERQHSLCAICHAALALGKTTHVDHDHTTGRVRGLLCSRCNPGLGAFRDNINILQSAIAYLQNSRGAK